MEKLYRAAFDYGVNVVSANKQPLALPQGAREELLSHARKHFRAYHYETTVGAALPVIETLKTWCAPATTSSRSREHFPARSATCAISWRRGFRFPKRCGPRANSATRSRIRATTFGPRCARKAVILARELRLKLDLTDVELKPFVPEKDLQEDDPESSCSR